MASVTKEQKQTVNMKLKGSELLADEDWINVDMNSHQLVNYRKTRKLEKTTTNHWSKEYLQQLSTTLLIALPLSHLSISMLKRFCNIPLCKSSSSASARAEAVIVWARRLKASTITMRSRVWPLCGLVSTRGALRCCRPQHQARELKPSPQIRSVQCNSQRTILQFLVHAVPSLLLASCKKKKKLSLHIAICNSNMHPVCIA